MTRPAPRTLTPITPPQRTQMEADQIAARDLKDRFDALRAEFAGAGDHHAHHLAAYRLLQELGPVALTDLTGRLAGQLSVLKEHLQHNQRRQDERERARSLALAAPLARKAWNLVHSQDEPDPLRAAIQEALSHVRPQLQAQRFKGGPLMGTPQVRGGQMPDRYVRLAVSEKSTGTLTQAEATLYVQALRAALLSLKLITPGGALAVSPGSLSADRPLTPAERARHTPQRRSHMQGRHPHPEDREFMQARFSSGRMDRPHRQGRFLQPDCDAGELEFDPRNEREEIAQLQDERTLSDSADATFMLNHMKESDERTSPALPQTPEARALQAEARSLRFLLGGEKGLGRQLWNIWTMGELAGRLWAQLQAEEAEKRAADEANYDPASQQLLTVTAEVWSLARAWAARHEQLSGLIAAPRITPDGRAVLPLCQNVPGSMISARIPHALHEDDANLYVAGLKFIAALLDAAPPVITEADITATQAP